LDQLSPNGSFVTLPVISPDGKWGATWGADAPSQFPMGHGQSTLIGVLPYTNPAEYILSWDLSTAQPIAAVRPTSRFSVSSLAFSPDGRWLALGGMSRQSVQDGIYKKQPSGRLRGELEVWDWRSGRSVWQGQVKSSVGCMAWSATGLLAEGGGDYVNYQIQGTKYSGIVNTSGEVNIWDPLRHKLMLHRSFASAPEAVALTPDAKELVVFETLRGLTAWNTHSGALRQELKGPVSSEGGVFMGRMHLIDSLAISGNGRWLASSGPNHDRILVWNLPGGTFHGEYTTTLWRNSQSQPTDDAYALSPDGQWLAVGSSNIREITLHRLSSD
jgi:WD40 repeat protein